MTRAALGATAVACALLAAVVVGQALGTEGRAGVVVRWSTASEIDTVGFHLYRSESREGPFQRVTTSPVPASDDPLAGGAYAYQDDDLEPGRTYYYQLEDLERSGTATRHGPVEATAGRAASSAPLLLSAAALAAAALWLAAGALRHPRGHRPATKEIDADADV